MSKDKVAPQKAKFQGRRREVTRRSGFHSHKNASGLHFSYGEASNYVINKNSQFEITFDFPDVDKEKFLGFGFYYKADNPIDIEFDNSLGKHVLTKYPYPSWNKFGYISNKTITKNISILFKSDQNTNIDIYDAKCGEVWHEYFENSVARNNVMKNIHIYPPEALFITKEGRVNLSIQASKKSKNIPLKECNRCARLLPVNFDDEKDALSFSKHKRFIKLRKIENNKIIQFLEHGFQLECRFCKCFAVNAALNPQRSAAQMKEDGQRRRHFEKLLEELFGTSKQLNYKYETGKELVNQIWIKFDKKCFNCGCKINKPRNMHLDHTRPLADLWPLDSSATALCSSCNSQKSAKPPCEFYNDKKLKALSEITHIPFTELKNPKPNLRALELLIQKREWLYSKFLNTKSLNKIKNGKRAAELICKSLDRVHDRLDHKILTESFVDGWKKYNGY